MTHRDVDVIDVRNVGGDTIALTLSSPPSFDPKPGQFVLVTADIEGSEHSRHYTMSSPTAEETFELTVEVDPDGTLSGWLADRRPGDHLTIKGPFGRIFYDGESTVVAIGGGPGIGAALGVAERAHATGNTTGLIAHRESGAIPHLSRLSTLARDGHPVAVTRSTETLGAAVTQLLTDAPDAVPFVFGFRPFVEAVRTAIDDAGIDPERARIENYG